MYVYALPNLQIYHRLYKNRQQMKRCIRNYGRMFDNLFAILFEFAFVTKRGKIPTLQKFPKKFKIKIQEIV